MDQTSRKRRFFTPDLPDTPGESVELPSEQAHHATGVLRLGSGAAVELFDGRGTVATGHFTDVGRRRATVLIDAIDRAPRPQPQIHVAFAVPKGERTDWLLEKATELGAASLQPVLFERSVAGGADLSEQKRRRWLGHCISAATQCELNFLPEIRDPISLADFLRGGDDTLDILGDCADDSPGLLSALGAAERGRDIRLLIGPEGDFTPAERAAAVEAGMIPARLGTTTLRVETAAIALLAAVTAIVSPTESRQA